MSTVEQTTGTLVERFSLKALVECCLVLEEGVAGIKDIDIGMMAGAGILPGPFARADEQGLDVVLESLERAQAEWGEWFEPPLILRRLVAQGRLGRKSGQGFFPYPQPDAGEQRETVLVETRGDVDDRLAEPPAGQPAVAAARGRAQRGLGVGRRQGAGVRDRLLEPVHVLRRRGHQGVHAHGPGDGRPRDGGADALAGPLDGALAHRHDRVGELDRVRRRLRAGDGLRLPHRGRLGHASASPRSTSASSPASAAPSGCRGWWGRPRRSR